MKQRYEAVNHGVSSTEVNEVSFEWRKLLVWAIGFQHDITAPTLIRITLAPSYKQESNPIRWWKDLFLKLFIQKRHLMMLTLGSEIYFYCYLKCIQSSSEGKEQVWWNTRPRYGLEYKHTEDYLMLVVLFLRFCHKIEKIVKWPPLETSLKYWWWIL